MHQTTLWDSVAMDRALCRATDPTTSQDAAAQIAASLSGAKAAMYRAFCNGPKTDNEAARWCVCQHGRHMHETYRKRAHELRAMGLIRPALESRRCGVTGYSAIVYEVVR